MSHHISKSVFLLLITVVIVCGIYPGVVWVIGHVFFPFQAEGSLLKGPDGQVIGSKLIAQPFTKDEYFQPRPSAASYDASASASSTLAPSNYLLRDRVARMIGPIVKYQSGPKAGQLVAPDIEAWFQQDRYQGNPGIVAQWADLHNGLAAAWVGADPTHGAYVDSWAKAHPALVSGWVKANPRTPQPKAADLAVVFFENFSKESPGRFPSAVTHTGADGKATTAIEPVKDGSDIQSIFFDTWRQDHPDADLQNLPGDLVTTSGSGLDPDITLQNAEYQLDRVASKWADDTKRDPAAIRREIDQILQANAKAPFGGLAGEKMVRVLEVNLELRKRYGAPK
ncbi:MAG: potassium-transporting ATPase subunit C [Bryobacteraceae bacterium]|jgi:K+-transporting ATPase ATPase C chain